MRKNVLLSGCSGRMGQGLISLMKNSEEWTYAYGFSSKATAENEVSQLSDVDPNKVDIVIDFSLPEAFEQALTWAVENKKPFLSGTTGLSEKQRGQLSEAAKTIPVLLSANTSLGINLLNSLIAQLSPLKNFDVQIVEAHHNKKLDAPSGTAKLLQKSIQQHLNPEAPAPLAVRGGGIFGEHEIRLMSDEEVIVLKHTALNRNVFAKGALVTAAWLISKPAGQYTMADVFGGM